MADVLSLDLVEKGIVTNQIVLTIGYDRESLSSGKYQGETVIDYYGREVLKHAHGTINLDRHTSSTKIITEAVMKLFDAIADPDLLSRRLGIAACNVISEEDIPREEKYEQMSIFDLAKTPEDKKETEEKLAKERALQEAMLELKHKYGKNAVVKAKNLNKGGTAMERNEQIGGHKA
jgi:DNA polymerase V